MPDQNLMMEKSRWYDGNIYFMSERSISSVITSPLKLPTYSPNWQSYGNHIDNMKTTAQVNPVSQQKKGHSLDAGWMLGQRRRRWANIQPALGEYVVSAARRTGLI